MLATLLLTLSNLLFLPAIAIALHRYHLVEATVYTFTMFFSTVGLLLLLHSLQAAPQGGLGEQPLCCPKATSSLAFLCHCLPEARLASRHDSGLPLPAQGSPFLDPCA